MKKKDYTWGKKVRYQRKKEMNCATDYKAEEKKEREWKKKERQLKKKKENMVEINKEGNECHQFRKYFMLKEQWLHPFICTTTTTTK